LHKAQVDRVLHFPCTDTEQAVEEISVVIRNIADIKQASDSKENALVLQARLRSPNGFPLLDQPSSEIAVAQKSPNLTSHEYRISTNPDDVVRLFYLTNIAPVESFHEVATAVRAALDIRRMFT
jgi:hypothetical protein